MSNTVLFGNGLNRVSNSSISWDELLNQIKADQPFSDASLPNTMVYERIFMEKNSLSKAGTSEELRIKTRIAEAMLTQESNELYTEIIDLGFDNYITTNYDYAFEKAIGCNPELLSTEGIYSLRRKRAYKFDNRDIKLWNIHGEIDHPKSIMLGLDHYCGSVSKLDAYVKGRYSFTESGKKVAVSSMNNKLKNQQFCNTSWADLFFSSNVHIIGLSLDYSETDLWWVLNKRARMIANHSIDNKVFFYTNAIDDEKRGLLESFSVKVVIKPVIGSDYYGMYSSIINGISSKKYINN